MMRTSDIRQKPAIVKDGFALILRKRMDYLSFLKITRIIREVNKCWENSAEELAYLETFKIK